MCTKNELNRMMQKLLQIYRSVYGEKLDRVILYGSYARGDYNKDSDVDIVAIVHGERKKLQEQLKQVWDSSSELELEYDTIVSPTVIPYEEFEQYQDDLPYYRNIAREGVDYSKHAGVISYFQKEYIKTGQFDKKYLKYLSQAFQVRNNTDYSDFFIVSQSDAKEQYEKAEEFLDAIENYLSEQKNDHAV